MKLESQLCKTPRNNFFHVDKMSESVFISSSDRFVLKLMLENTKNMKLLRKWRLGYDVMINNKFQVKLKQDIKKINNSKYMTVDSD